MECVLEQIDPQWGMPYEDESIVPVFPPVFEIKKQYTVALSLWFNVTTRCRPLRKFPKSQFEPSEIAKCLPSGIIEFGAKVIRIAFLNTLTEVPNTFKTIIWQFFQRPSFRHCTAETSDHE